MDTEQKLMPYYGGIKVVQAQPMSAEVAKSKGYKTGTSEGGDEGYEVCYEDGYLSWAPRMVFEANYDPMDGAPENGTHARMLRYFAYGHLPARLQAVSQPFAVLAYRIARRCGDPAETTVALRKLLEAKDCAVRAML